MQGLDVIKSERAKDTIRKMLDLMYSPNLYDTDEIEDLVLFTEERTNYSTIGTESIKMSTMRYMLTNMYWISVCLFVNADFRGCFDDAIAIEKALLQVNDQEYEDFRDEMTLDSSDDSGTDAEIVINIDNYNDQMEVMLCNGLSKASQEFINAGMKDVYLELMDTFDKKTLAEIRYTIHNMIYVINAMNRNGVFKKYVRLVVESVKKQLS